jgi:carboxypeptidase Q
MKTHASWFVVSPLVVAAAFAGFQVRAQSQNDPVVSKIIELGTKDNQVMTWNDYASNRFGGRETGTNAYTDATAWLAWQFKQWGLEAELDEVGEVPVGFNRGPWFGKMIAPTLKPLRFGTPSFTAGTKGVQRGPVFVLKADPFSIAGRATGGQPIAKDIVAKKETAVQAALAEIIANRAAIKGAWVLIAADPRGGFGRDGRRGSKLADGSPEYLDAVAIPPVTKALVDAGALGTISPSTPPSAAQPGNSEPPLSMLDGYAASWDKLPVLPDIRLLDTQYNEIKALFDKKEKVELEFDIRNWFKMGPIKYHNVVATLRGTTYPDEYIVIGGHFDCFSSATGGVDDGSGFAPGMEAVRLIKAAGAKPKRSIIFIAFAAEENGLVGSQSWLKKHPEIQPKVMMMINRDGSPSAITGATVPETWFADIQRITAPLTNLNPKWPFKLVRGVPRAHATSPGGTDSSSFEMMSVPTFSFANTTARPGPDGKEINYTYNYAWHTLNDLYSELVPYTEHQQHSALVTAVVAYGVANLDKPLSRDSVYLPDGLFADITVGPADAPFHIMTTLDYVNAPIQTANFIRIIEGKAPPAGGGRGGGPGGPGGARPEVPPIGKIIAVKDKIASGVIASEIQKTVAVAKLPKTLNKVLKHNVGGILGVQAPNSFYLTQQKDLTLDKKYTAIGKVIAGADLLTALTKDMPVRSVRITRVGQDARDFKTDDESFKKLLGPAPKKPAPAPKKK